MLKKLLPALLAITVLLAACTPQSAPTMSPADVQGTALSSAWTMVALTQTAMPTQTLMPTNTPLPPTETPSPTLEPLTATIEPSDPNNCLKPLNMGDAGPTKNVRIENETKSQVNLSLNLYKPNDFGQCGALSYVIKSGETRKISIPSGYWSAYGWVEKPASTPVGGWYIGPSASQDLLRIVIKADVIVWVGP